MWIEEITLGDFGCFQDARMTGLEEGLTVIAGPQRAGKSTFMKAIRRLGYGVDRGTDLPPPADRYDVRAEVDYEGFTYEIELDHLAEPRVTPLDRGAPDRTARELFGGVRREQYRQLYTVSLDELHRTPPSLDDEADLSRILLGAGFGEASTIPDITDDLARDAHEIGRTTGLRGGPIRESIKQIEAGIEAKDDAVAQVDEYERTEDRLESVRVRIRQIAAEEEALEREATRLEVVDSEWAKYERIRELRRQVDDDEVEAVETFPLDELSHVRTLADQYRGSLENLVAERSTFDSEVSVSTPDEYREGLLQKRAAIEHAKDQLARYERELERLETSEDNLDEKRRTLDEKICDIHPSWESVEDVRETDTDLFAREEIGERFDAYETADEKVDRLTDTVEELSGQAAQLDDRIEEAGDRSTAASTRHAVVETGVGTLAAVALGAVTGTLLGTLVGIGVTAMVMLGLVAWIHYPFTGDAVSHEGVSVEHLRAQKQEREAEIDTKREQLSTAEAERDAARNALGDVVTEYDLPNDTAPATAKEFYVELLDVRADIDELDRRREDLEDDRSELDAELTEVASLLEELGVLEEAIGDPVAEDARLFGAIEQAVSHLELATSVRAAEHEVERREEELRPYLEQWDDWEPSESRDDAFADGLTRFLERGEELQDVAERKDELDHLEAGVRAQLEKSRVSSAFEPVRTGIEADEPSPLDLFEAVYERHESRDALEERLDAIESELARMRDEAEEKREEVSRLNVELEDLESDDDVRAAHERIQNGQSALERRLETYAHYRIAEYVLNELHERYLDRTTGPLLETASDIFERVTDGAYETVESENEFHDLDLVAEGAGGMPHTSAELSRATREQLFLSVRLAKIQRADRPLPVLIDDSLTNFDPSHVHRTLDVLSELADGQQVFLLTCHPSMVDTVAGFHDATYWTLDGGTFDGPSTDPDAAKAVLEGGNHRPSAGTEGG